MKPSSELCNQVHCHKLWPDIPGGGADRCSVFGMVPGHMEYCPEKLLNSYDELLEVLARLEHVQWVAWSKEIAKTEDISPERLERWKRLWKSYSVLSEEQKEQDRKWAKKVLTVLLKERLVDVNILPEEVTKHV